jgi:hypothetical protein
MHSGGLCAVHTNQPPEGTKLKASRKHRHCSHNNKNRTEDKRNGTSHIILNVKIILTRI